METGKVVLVLLMVVTVVGVVLVSIDCAKYEAYKQGVINEHPELEPWMDFKPYFIYNSLAFASVLAVSLAWLGYVKFAIRKVRAHAV